MDKFGPELLVIQFGFLVLLSTLFLWLWFSNRKKYHNLKHAIPANIVKSYLDSIIQNSTALKSSLFRGGGLEVNGIPSVIPLGNLMGGDSLGMSGAPSTALMEELNQKKALIASLESQLSSSQNSQRELEAKIVSLQASLAAAEAKIKELEALLAQMRADGGGDAALKSELKMLSKERDEIRDRLKEFEIISDDLANLKRLQQENEQLKRSLGAQSLTPVVTSAPATPVSDPTPAAQPAPLAEVSEFLQDLGQSSAPESTDTQALEEFLSTPDEDPTAGISAEAQMLAAMDEVAEVKNEVKPKSEKTPEDLLSEFEKMLG